MDVPALVTPSCESGATSLASLILAEKQKRSIHSDLKKAARCLAAVKHQKGQRHASVPPNSRFRQKAFTFATPMAMTNLSTNLWTAGVILFSLDNLVRTPTMARTTPKARTTRLARMAGMGRKSTDFLSRRQITLQISLPVSRLFLKDFAYRHYHPRQNTDNQM